jgi:hypothetical protein
VFDRDAADLAFSINVDNRILVEFSAFSHFDRSEFDVQRIGILKVFNYHGLKDLSKKA